MNHTDKNIIIFIPNGFGDIVMLHPAMSKILENKNIKKILLIVKSESHASLLDSLVHSPRVDYYSFNSENKKISNLLALFFRLYFFKSKLIYAPLLSNKASNKVFFSLMFKKLITPGNLKNNSKSKQALHDFLGHQVNYYLNFFEGIISDNHNNDVKFSDYQLWGRTKNKEKYIVINMVSGFDEMHKIPTSNYFIELINKIHTETDYTVKTYCFDNERVYLENIHEAVNCKDKLQIVNNPNLASIKGLISGASGGICGTTGQGHIMALSDIPIIVLSGVTEALESGPYSKNIKILKHNLECSPCYQESFRFGCGKVQCMNSISQDLIINNLRLIKTNNFPIFNWKQSKKKPVIISKILNIHAIN